MKFFRMQTKGQVLVEAMVALTVLTVGIGGTVVLLGQSASANRLITDNYIGTYLAAEGIEVMKSLVKLNGFPQDGAHAVQWNTECYDSSCAGYAPDPSQPLHFDSTRHLYSYDPGGTLTTFKRTITTTMQCPPGVDCSDPSLAPSSAHELKVVSEVTWTSIRGVSFSVKLEDHFFKGL